MSNNTSHRIPKHFVGKIKNVILYLSNSEFLNFY